MFVVLFALAAIFVGFGMYRVKTDPDAAQRAKQRTAIEHCEDEYAQAQEDPRHDRNTLALIYGACDLMKDDFRKQWGREP